MRRKKAVHLVAPRWFVLRDAHTEGAPVLFQPRWAMSFLRGLITRRELTRALHEHNRENADAVDREAAAP